ncbi:hypothetical protein H5410_063568 [Solanum commersonii]|uniref:Uncharacterized protein n=1 Tax=Solanum commersonii TaxID=4109 RepID=A0A9J5WDW3_SOLCO|nr:hypothetical protein H5410_063568 [Solanum commersonii]
MSWIDSNVLGEPRGVIPQPQGRFLAGNGAGTLLGAAVEVKFGLGLGRVRGLIGWVGGGLLV